MTDDAKPTDTDTPQALSCLPRLRRGKAFFEVDSMARLGLHIKLAEQALIAAKTEALKPFGLPVAQYAVLMALYYHPGQSSAQLARTAAVTPQTMASVLARLEGKKLISRTPSEAHAKVLLTSLTKEGEELVLQADEHARAVEQRLLDEFTQAEQEQLKDLLTRARELLRTQPKRPPTP